MSTVGFNHCVMLGQVCSGPWEIAPAGAAPYVAFRLQVAEPGTKTSNVYHLYIPVVCFGNMRPIANDLVVGDPLIVMGRLTWLKTQKAPKGALAVSAWKITHMMAADAGEPVEWC